MNIRTKVITTIIAMVCSLSVSATGIVAILLEFNMQVANTTALQLGEIQGDLYGERYGADNQDLVMQHLFKYGEGEQTSELNYFCRDVSFSNNSKQIEYLFKFVLATDAEAGVIVSLTQAELSNTTLYNAEYKVGYSQVEPDWNTAETITSGTKYVVDSENPYIWLRATLTIRKDNYQRIEFNTEASWSFSFNFEGLEQAS